MAIKRFCPASLILNKIRFHQPVCRIVGVAKMPCHMIAGKTQALAGCVVGLGEDTGGQVLRHAIQCPGRRPVYL